MSTSVAILLVPVANAVLFAVIFHNPNRFMRAVRCILQHRRDHAAAVALRKMKHNDIRRSR